MVLVYQARLEADHHGSHRHRLLFQILLATDQHAYAATSESGPDCSAAGNGWPLRRAVRDDGPRA
jgi:hypothetical protein